MSRSDGRVKCVTTGCRNYVQPEAGYCKNCRTKPAEVHAADPYQEFAEKMYPAQPPVGDRKEEESPRNCTMPAVLGAPYDLANAVEPQTGHGGLWKMSKSLTERVTVTETFDARTGRRVKFETESGEVLAILGALGPIGAYFNIGLDPVQGHPSAHAEIVAARMKQSEGCEKFSMDSRQQRRARLRVQCVEDQRHVLKGFPRRLIRATAFRLASGSAPAL